MSNTSIKMISVFEKYQRERVIFVQKLSELANRPRNIEGLKLTGALDLLRSLLTDTVPSIQQSAALSIGRMANYSTLMAERVITGEILPIIVQSLSDDNKHFVRASCFILRSVAKHNSRFAQAVVDVEAIPALVKCLNHFDSNVREEAAWAIGYISKHNKELATTAEEGGAIKQLINCIIGKQTLSLQKICTSALTYISSHSPKLANSIVEVDGILPITKLLRFSSKNNGLLTEIQLAIQVCSCLSQICKHSVELAEQVVKTGIIPKTYKLLLSNYPITLRKNVAILIKEISKHSHQLCSILVDSMSIPFIVSYINDTQLMEKQKDRELSLPGIHSIGYFSGFSNAMALEVANSKAIIALRRGLEDINSDHIRASAAWTIGQIARHSKTHSSKVIKGNVLHLLINSFQSENSSEELKKKSKKSLKYIIEKCYLLQPLTSLLNNNIPEIILKYTINQFSKILLNNTNAKKDFVKSGGFAKLQLIHAEQGSSIRDNIEMINSYFPNEVVNYFDPNYEKELFSTISPRFHESNSFESENDENSNNNSSSSLRGIRGLKVRDNSTNQSLPN